MCLCVRVVAMPYDYAGTHTQLTLVCCPHLPQTSNNIPNSSFHRLPASPFVGTFCITCRALPPQSVPFTDKRVHQHTGMHSHILGYPSMWECVSICWGIPAYGNAFSHSGGAPAYGNVFPYTGGTPAYIWEFIPISVGSPTIWECIPKILG